MTAHTVRDAAKSSGTRPPLPAVPGYEVLQEIGRGGMAVVYLARQTSLGREVALKVVPGGAFARADERARFRREAEVVARFKHPNILQIFDFGEVAGQSYIALEYVPGGTLGEWAAGGLVPPRKAARIIATLARAVEHAHAAGVLHRDLKPANILLAPADDATPAMDAIGADPPSPIGGVARARPTFRSPWSEAGASPRFIPKIADFGLAKDLGGPDLTVAGMVCGTPNYMAPEQLAPDAALGPAVDVYQLGGLLYELLTGRPPVVGMNAADIMQRVVSTPPLAPRQLAPGVPWDLEVIALHCLEKAPGRRYPSAAALAADLDRFLAGRPIRVRPVRRRERAVRWAKRHPAEAAMVGVLAIAAGVGAGLSARLYRAEAAARASIVGLEIERALAQTADVQQERQQKRADENLQLARRVTRATLLELATDPTLRDRRHFALRLRLLDRAKPFFDEFVAQATDDPEVLREQAELCTLLAGMRADLGEPAVAAAQYDQAEAAYRRLAHRRPDDAEIALALCDVLLKGGRIHRNTGRGRTGDENVDEATARLAALHARMPASDPVARELARARLAWAHATSDATRRAAAEGQYRQAMELAAGVLARSPDDAAAQNVVGRAHRELGQALARRGACAEASVHFAGAIEVRMRFVESEPNNPEQSADLAEIYAAAAANDAAAGFPAVAVPLMLQAIAAGQRAIDEAPLRPEYRTRLAGYEVQLIAFQRAAGK